MFHSVYMQRLNRLTASSFHFLLSLTSTNVKNVLHACMLVFRSVCMNVRRIVCMYVCILCMNCYFVAYWTKTKNNRTETWNDMPIINLNKYSQMSHRKNEPLVHIHTS